MSNQSEFDAVLEALEESGACSKETAKKLRAAQSIIGAVNAERRRLITGLALMAASPAMWPVAHALSFVPGLEEACVAWSTLMFIAGGFFAVTLPAGIR